MKRIFVTTNFEKLLGMFEFAELESAVTQVKEKFTTFPQTYLFDTGFVLVILEDTFDKWEDYSIDKKNDGILYHLSSPDKVKNTILDTFDYTVASSHLRGKSHDKLFRALLGSEQNDAKKASQIISELFKPVMGDDDSRTTIQEAQKAFRQFYKSCVLGLIKSRNETDTSEELRNLQGELFIIEKYVKGKLDVQVSFDKLRSETSIESFHHFLNANHQKLEAEIFGG